MKSQRKWKFGEKRADGYIFKCYRRYKCKDGTISLHAVFLNPSYFKRETSWHTRNKQKSRKYFRDYYAKNAKKSREKVYAWRKRNPDYQKKRFAKYPEAKMAAMLRRRILKALDGEVKSGSTYELLGCTWKHLRWHIESQFDGKMTWENHGSYWHLDHITPLDSFDLSDPAQQRRACHWKNLQPLEAKENIRKKNRLLPPRKAKSRKPSRSGS